jgi:ribonuclease III
MSKPAESSDAVPTAICDASIGDALTGDALIGDALIESRLDIEAALAGLAQRLEWQFDDPKHLRRSVAHRSWCAESGEESNERLEFLGDAVLGLAVTNYIFHKYPTLPEGDLAKMRAGVVNSLVLADVARELNLGDALLLGKGEDWTGGREKTSILADALEAVIGAVYLDGGWEPAEQLVLRLIADRIVLSADGPGGQDYKTRLQELVARHFEQLPVYRTADEGPDHAKVFFARVFVLGTEHGVGEGRSKKQAEQAAARQAWTALSRQVSDATAAAE